MSDHDIKTVTRYVTIDGKDHSTLHAAKWWRDHLEKVQRANDLLRAGESLADAAEASGSRLTDEDREVLAQATHETGIVIEHWQLGKFPSYSVGAVTPEGPYVGGIGGWMGSYGNTVPWRDVARYLRGTIEAVGIGPVISYSKEARDAAL